jgi:hypothetical protein
MMSLSFMTLDAPQRQVAGALGFPTPLEVAGSSL